MDPRNTQEYDLIRRSAPTALPGAEKTPEGMRRPNLCPFGCSASDHDDKGYCCHLEGFTDGRKNPATGRVLYERTYKKGGSWVTGEMKTVRLENGDFEDTAFDREVQDGDVIVELNNGLTGPLFAGTQWSRVYRPRRGERRQTAPRPAKRNLSTNPQVAEMQGIIANQQAMIENMADELANLKDTLGVTEPSGA